ncbi:choice-of-anchor K domain-containing protein [Horticoccus luteus]|uniref:Choice-of-anchor K domain-containing protein n=2 Tax=Horticoccus luteus TaxID=2862869 RepID=A0A8F9TX44_9BACT|nr:choice-of-anchor K domain-containing protein [Horticoccus luteus]
MLSGHTTGSFTDLSEANTTVTNAGDGSFAVFKTGVPAPGSFQSSIVFTNATFTNVTSGDPIQVGLFTITNGTTLIGSGAHYATFNLGLELGSPSLATLMLSQFNFTIDHTVNSPGLVPDQFAVSFTPPAPVLFAGYDVNFSILMDSATFDLAEGASVVKGAVYVSFSPVPEPSTYAICGAALLGGLVLYRRLRSNRPARGLAA